MKVKKIIVIETSSGKKFLKVSFEYFPVQKGYGRLYYDFGEGWQYWEMYNYKDTEDAIKGFCRQNWGKRLLGIYE